MKKKKNDINKNSVILMFAVMAGLVFMLGMIIVMFFVHI